MANYVERARALIGNTRNKDAPAPSGAFLVRLADAFVRRYPGDWKRVLDSQGFALNPNDESDLLDVGTLDASDPPVFTPAGNPAKNRLKALHYIQQIRIFNREVLVTDRKLHGSAAAEDVGAKPEAIRERLVTDAVSESLIELGDPDNDPEA